MDATVRPLADADLPEILEFLRPTEQRSTFLLGNALECGITDRGGPRNGLWLGAFEDGRLEGVLAHAKGPRSLVPACGGHARALLAEADARGVRPEVIVGTADRVAETVEALPPSWRVARRQRETLMVLRWARYVPPPPPRVPAGIGLLTLDRAEEGGRLMDVLCEESGLPRTPADNRVRAERDAKNGAVFAATLRTADGSPGGALASMSTEAAATGRWVHVGGTVTLPEHRRRGLCGPCVAAVLDRARAQGRASEGAVLFTGEGNAPALALYGRLGFEVECPFEMCFLAHDAVAAT